MGQVILRLKAMVGRTYKSWLFRLRPRCPSCGHRTLEARQPAASHGWDPTHAFPDYYQCEDCGSRYKQSLNGGLETASGGDDDHYFTQQG